MMEYKNTGAVYEARTYGSVRGMGHKASPYSMPGKAGNPSGYKSSE